MFEHADSAQLTDKVQILLESREPAIQFEAHGLSREVQDDHLIASMLARLNEDPAADVVLVTSDTGLLLLGKARRAGFRTMELDSNLRLPEEVDAARAEIQRLRQELHEAKFRVPNLNLQFEDGKSFHKFSLAPHQPAGAEWIAREMAVARGRLPKLEMERPVAAPGGLGGLVARLNQEAMLRASLFSPSQSQIDDYNKELAEYFRDLEAHLKEREKYEERKARTLELRFWVANGGNTPGEDIDILMHFPDGFDLLSEAKFRKPPAAPEPPSPPRSSFQSIQESLARIRPYDPQVFVRGLTDIASGKVAPRNVSRPIIIRKRSFEVHVEVGSVKHYTKEPLDPLFVVFDSLSSAHSFHVDYVILAANVPEPVKERLHLAVDLAGTGLAERPVPEQPPR